MDVFEWCRQISVRDTAAIAARCRERGPFAEAALSGEEVALLDNMMARVDALASIAAEVRGGGLLLGRVPWRAWRHSLPQARE